MARVELLHFSGDKGLCGSFNANLFNRAQKWIKEQKENGVDIRLTVVGKRGRDFFKKRGL